VLCPVCIAIGHGQFITQEKQKGITMKKVKLQMQLSIDGFVAGPAGETDWRQCNWDAGLKDYVKELKEEPGADLIECDGRNFDISLIKEGLIDEYYFFINPTALGKGTAVFQSIGEVKNLRLVTARPFECGVVLLFYKPE
jgi:dihydrofolate reductase